MQFPPYVTEGKTPYQEAFASFPHKAEVETLNEGTKNV